MTADPTEIDAEIVRQKDSKLEAAVMSFMETIDAKTLDRMNKSGIFSPQQMILFTTILETMAGPVPYADMRRPIP